MSSPNFSISTAIGARVQKLEIEWPVIPVEAWDAVEEAGDPIKQDHYLEGRLFFSKSLKTFLQKQAFRGPVESYDVVQDAVFSMKTIGQLLGRTRIKLNPVGYNYKSFMLFIGLAVKELGEDFMARWFAATFGPLVIVAEGAYVNHYAMLESSRGRRPEAEEENPNPAKRIKTDREHFAPCAILLKNIRAKQPRVQRSKIEHRRCNRGLVSRVVSSVSAFLTNDIPTFLAKALFGPELDLPPGPSNPHPDLALRMSASSSTVPSAAVFAPTFNVAPARLPAPSAQDPDADWFCFHNLSGCSANATWATVYLQIQHWNHHLDF
ncbi:hypothetical protein B0H11DRAFT_2271809 [Mycena galericulata]|nr:hypothetical protein B0H11DRAFT_2271809 [Mycena galericulata]